MNPWHLAKRFVQSIDNTNLSDHETARARVILLEGEYDLWMQMQPRDQRHSLLVFDRFTKLMPEASLAENRAVLLHDVGKSASRLGVLGRVLATLFGPRTSEMRRYLEHEKIGRSLLNGISEQRTLEVLAMDDDDVVCKNLRRADDL